MADLGNAQRIEFPQEVGDGALEQFRNESDNDRFNFQEEMINDGARYSEGGRHDFNQRGFTSQTLEDQQTLVEEQQQWAPQEENLFVPPQQSQQERDWKRLYGQSENEKGELRRNMQALQDRLLQLEQQQQQAALYATMPPPPQFYGAPQPQQQAQYQPQQAQVAPQQVDWTRIPKLIDKDDNEMLLPSDLDRVLREKVAPYVFHVEQQAQMAHQQAMLAQQRFFESQKQQSGVTPQLEMQILAGKPWLRNIQDPGAYLSAMQQEVAMLRAAQQAQTVQDVRQSLPQQQQRQAVQADVRRRTFVERGNGTSQEPTMQKSAEAIWQEEWQKTLMLSHGDPNRTKRQQQLLKHAGFDPATGYRNPSILTR